jgi:hypothetical protein
MVQADFPMIGDRWGGKPSCELIRRFNYPLNKTPGFCRVLVFVLVEELAELLDGVRPFFDDPVGLGGIGGEIAVFFCHAGVGGEHVDGDVGPIFFGAGGDQEFIAVGNGHQ